jgi:hypothetical protein
MINQILNNIPKDAAFQAKEQIEIIKDRFENLTHSFNDMHFDDFIILVLDLGMNEKLKEDQRNEMLFDHIAEEHTTFTIIKKLRNTIAGVTLA